jgi:diguanylate cyclase (GGDEF)-like protein/PAS domain S-box-containing protein
MPPDPSEGTAAGPAVRPGDGAAAPAVLDAVGDLVAVVDEDLRVRYLSASNARALGYPVEAMRGRRITANVLPADRARLVQAVRSVLTGAEERSVVQFRAGRADGATSAFETVITPLPGPRPQVVLATRDVTERVDSEVALRRRAAGDALVSELSRALLEAGAEEFDEIVVASLRCTAAFLGADEAVFFRTEGDCPPVPTHRWCQGGGPEEGDGADRSPGGAHTGGPSPVVIERTTAPEPSEVPYDTADVPALARELAGRARALVRVGDDDPGTAATRAELARRGFAAGAIVPVRVQDRVAGVLAFGWRHDPKRLDGVRLDPLVVLADVLVSAAERHNALLSTRRQEQRFRLLAEHASDFAFVYGADRTVTYVSPAARRFLGIDEGFRLADHPQFVHPEDHEAVLDQFGRLLTAGAGAVTPAFGVRVRRADGVWRWVEMVATNLLEDPSVAGMLINGRDVTEQREAARALAASEARWRAVVQGIADVVTLVDPDGTIRYTSPAATRIFGFRPGHLSETDPLSHVHPDDAGRLTAEFAELLGGRRTEPVSFRIRDAAGRWRHVESTAVDHRRDPLVGGVLVTTRDVTARARAEQLLADQAATLRRIARGDPLPEVMHELCRSVERYDDSWRCTVMLADPSGSTLRLSAAPSLPARMIEVLEAGIPVAEGVGTCGTAAARRSVVFTPDVADDEAWAPWQDLAAQVGIRSCWSVPMLDSAGRVVATLAVYGSRPGAPDGEVRRIVETLADLGSVAVERELAETRLAHQAHHDPLTGLPNRTLFMQLLERSLARAVRTGAQVAVLFCDLDRFKVVNDSLGHSFGDRMLVELARRLQRVIRTGDVIARTGGDEFAVLCDDLDAGVAPEHAARVAERILAEVDQVVDLDGLSARVTASVGVSIALPGADPAAVLRDADLAMYQAKDAGRACWRLFDDDIRRAVRARFDGEQRLRRALDDGALFLRYQPVVDPRRGSCLGVEALLRWRDVDGVVRRPDVELAEETGLIHPIGDVVLEQAVAQLARWRAELGDRLPTGFAMSVNLAAAQLCRADTAERMLALLDAHRVPPGALHVEITEGTLLLTEALDQLSELHAAGVRLAIDDFGTGYSSLGYLRQLPVDILKVDREFVAALPDDRRSLAVTRAVVEVGHALGLVVVGEGVETTSQRDTLVTLGVDLVQGYLYAPALDPDELRRRFLDPMAAAAAPPAGAVTGP